MKPLSVPERLTKNRFLLDEEQGHGGGLYEMVGLSNRLLLGAPHGRVDRRGRGRGRPGRGPHRARPGLPVRRRARPAVGVEGAVAPRATHRH